MVENKELVGNESVSPIFELTKESLDPPIHFS